MAQLERGKLCPLLKKDCVQLQCAWYTQVRGKDPNSGREVDEYACAIAWMPMLMINTANETRQGAAAVESLRNEMVTASESSLKLQVAIAGVQGKLPQLGQNKESNG